MLLKFDAEFSNIYSAALLTLILTRKILPLKFKAEFNRIYSAASLILMWIKKILPLKFQSLLSLSIILKILDFCKFQKFPTILWMATHFILKGKLYTHDGWATTALYIHSEIFPLFSTLANTKTSILTFVASVRSLRHPYTIVP